MNNPSIEPRENVNIILELIFLITKEILLNIVRLYH